MACSTVFRKDNLELRWRLPSDHDSEKFLEIVCWRDWSEHDSDMKGQYVYTLAMWRRTSEGPELRFIGGRPFDRETINPILFWALAEQGQKIAEADWNLHQLDLP